MTDSVSTIFGRTVATKSATGRDPGFVDLDRMYEDQCAAICGR